MEGNPLLRGARRYQTLREAGMRSSDSKPMKRGQTFIDRERQRSTGVLHDDARTGILSIMNSMHGMQRWEHKDRRNESFKLAVLQWCTAYAVAYSLMMTIAL
jgi:hypothetical protein